MMTGRSPEDRGSGLLGEEPGTERGVLGRAGGALLVMWVTGLLSVACSSGGHQATGTASTTPASSVSTSMESSTTTIMTMPDTNSAAAVEDAYRKGVAAVVDYESKTGPFDPGEFKALVSPFVTGSFYDSAFTAAQGMRQRGEVFQPPGVQPGELAPMVTMTGVGTARVRDCVADHGRFRAATGERVDRPGGRGIVVAEMVFEDQHWKIKSLTDADQPCTV